MADKITVDELKSQKNEFVIIDVRETDELEGGKIEERLVKAESMDAMKYYQGVLRTLDWAITGINV